MLNINGLNKKYLRYNDCIMGKTERFSDCLQCRYANKDKKTDCKGEPIHPLAYYRKKAGCTQLVLAQTVAPILGVKLSTMKSRICHCERGVSELRNFSLRVIITIADALNVDPHYFVDTLNTNIDSNKAGEYSGAKKDNK